MAICKPLTDEEIEAGRKKGQERADREPRVLSVAYNADRDRIELELDTGFALAIPRAELEGLADATPEQLASVQILGPGVAIAWNDPDVGFTVDGLWNQLYGTKRWMRELGRRTSERKAAAARANGTKGGRPKKARLMDHDAANAVVFITSQHCDVSGAVTLHRDSDGGELWVKSGQRLVCQDAYTVVKRAGRKPASQEV